jgi:hypothetical protein
MDQFRDKVFRLVGPKIAYAKIHRSIQKIQLKGVCVQFARRYRQVRLSLPKCSADPLAV